MWKLFVDIICRFSFKISKFYLSAHLPYWPSTIHRIRKSIKTMKVYLKGSKFSHELIFAVNLFSCLGIELEYFLELNFVLDTFKQDFRKEIFGFPVWAFNKYFCPKCVQSKIITQKWILTLKWKSRERKITSAALIDKK